ncbi:MAG: UDP binding domain-containing protein, partial [candidate division KSB1 bacterium]|nr:UDP binding domain-containing protein [candidate division KSB1 bacterium]
LLVAKGVVPDIDAAFDRYLGNGRPAYVDKFRIAASEAIAMINALTAEGARVQGHDPEALREAARIFKDRIGRDLFLFQKRYDALEGADALIIMTEWNAFREPDFYLIKETLKHPAIFDGRNLYDPKRMKKIGIDYFSIGRPCA